MNLHKLEIYASTPQNKKQNVTSVQGTLSSVPFPQGRLYPDFYYHRLVSKGTIIKFIKNPQFPLVPLWSLVVSVAQSPYQLKGSKIRSQVHIRR